MKKNIVIAILVVVATVTVFLQRSMYENKFELQEDKSVVLEEELSVLSSQNEDLYSELESADEDCEKLEADKQGLIEQIDELSNENNDLISHNEELTDKLLSVKYDSLKENLPDYWYKTWNDIYSSEGALTEKQIEEVNFLFQPIFSYNDWFKVNPLSCFFTSYYEDIKDINLDEFLRYCPYGEVLDDYPEFEDLKSHENWPFWEADNSSELPVPIHRYEKDVIQDIFTAYTSIRLDELTGVGLEYLIYIESTSAYYNFTSDSGWGVFSCTSGTVENGIIRLVGESTRSDSILTIIKENGQYVIKSFVEN